MLSRRDYRAIADTILSSPLLICKVEGEEGEVKAVELKALTDNLAAYFKSACSRFDYGKWCRYLER